ncbi:hypothetical protein ANN_09717 [Periplaneta americana]|uniref:Uncharacterized protein n=1 Tax=Periplaneta americana TaxID=6978 RepID=A0ABQ8TQ26_PERAM|nr:hypothetical protein ANN_09717 [Periplaneta americana]
MATVFFDSEGLLLVDITPHETIINSDAYVETLKKLQARLSSVRRHREKQDVLLLHDNAQPYRWIGRGTIVDNHLFRWPPYSSNLTQCDFFLLALDESIDRKDTAQPTIFIRSVTSDFNVHEDLVDSLMLAGNEFQSLGRAVVKEDEYEEVRWDGIVSIVSWRERVFRLWWEERSYSSLFFLVSARNLRIVIHVAKEQLFIGCQFVTGVPSTPRSRWRCGKGLWRTTRCYISSDARKRTCPVNKNH